jgi:hypothetical protein
MKRTNGALWAIVGFGLLCSAGARVVGEEGKPSISPEQVLQKTVDHHAVKASLAVALADFAVQSGIKVRVDWKTLEAGGIERSRPVSVDLEKATWRQVMDVILSRAGVRGVSLAWRVEGDEVLVSTQKQILAMTAETTRAMAAVKEAGKAKGDSGGKVLASVDFTDLPLKDVLKFFETVLNANFHVNWKALEQGGVSPATPISLDLKHISVARAMDLALDDINATREKLDRVYWILDHGVVLISTGTDFNRTMITRVIDAGTSMAVVPDFEAPRINLKAAAQAGSDVGTVGGGGGGGAGMGLFPDAGQETQKQGQSYDEQKKKQQEAVVESIKSTIGKEMWEPDGKGSIKVVGNKLVITQSLLGFKLMERALR